MCVCVAKPVAVELRCHATALILVIGKAQFRRAMLSCDSSCYYCLLHRSCVHVTKAVLTSWSIPIGVLLHLGTDEDTLYNRMY